MNVCTCKSICDRSILCNEVTDRGDMVHRAQLRDLPSVKPSVVHIRFGLSSSSAVQKKVCNFSSLCDKSLALFDGSVPHFFFFWFHFSPGACVYAKNRSAVTVITWEEGGFRGKGCACVCACAPVQPHFCMMREDPGYYSIYFLCPRVLCST